MADQKAKLARKKRAKTPEGSPQSSAEKLPSDSASESLPGEFAWVREIAAEAGRSPSATELLERGHQLLRTLIDLLPDFIFVKDTQCRFLVANRSLAKAYGRWPAELLFRTDADFMPPPIAAHCLAAEQQVLAGKSVSAWEDTVCFPDGRTRTVVTNMSAFRDAQGTVRGLVGIGRDITRRKQAEQLLRHANRTLQAIRDCHEAMLRAGTERELLDEICRIIVQSGGERMVWVGFVEKNSRKNVRPVASAGVSSDHLRNARVTWANVPRGRGPVGTAIRTKRPSVCHNTQTDTNFAPWRASARRHGYGSVLALPLLADQCCFGALAIYAPEPDSFDAGEQLMFTDLANDLAFGIHTLRLRAERETLEAEILKSSEREQERIGRDLHDGLCQLLVGAKFHSVYLQKISRDQIPEVEREAKALETLLNQAIEQARNLARGLNPVHVTPAGLVAALQQLAADVESAHGVHCFAQFLKPVEICDHHTTYHLYRIAQEAVQNATKHARARNISLALTRSDHRLRLIIKDDGVGLPRVPRKTGMGLNNMRTRARIIGGRLEIRRRRLGGTVVSCELPAS